MSTVTAPPVLMCIHVYMMVLYNIVYTLVSCTTVPHRMYPSVKQALFLIITAIYLYFCVILGNGA